MVGAIIISRALLNLRLLSWVHRNRNGRGIILGPFKLARRQLPNRTVRGSYMGWADARRLSFCRGVSASVRARNFELDFGRSVDR